MMEPLETQSVSLGLIQCHFSTIWTINNFKYRLWLKRRERDVEEKSVTCNKSACLDCCWGKCAWIVLWNVCLCVHTCMCMSECVLHVHVTGEYRCLHVLEDLCLHIDLEDLCAGQNAHTCQIQRVTLHILESWVAHAHQQSSPVLIPASCFRSASPIGNKNTWSVTRGWQELAFSTKGYVWEWPVFFYSHEAWWFQSLLLLLPFQVKGWHSILSILKSFFMCFLHLSYTASTTSVLKHFSHYFEFLLLSARTLKKCSISSPRTTHVYTGP